MNYNVKIIVEDEKGCDLERNYSYEEGRTDFNKEVADIVDSHEKSDENNLA